MIVRACRAVSGPLFYAQVTCPLGRALAAWTERGDLVRFDLLTEKSLTDCLHAWRQTWPQCVWRKGTPNPAFLAAFKQGNNESLPLLLCGTPFQIRVWRALLRIPRGQVVSYGDMAKNIGQPLAARAVGQAVGRNPIAVIVPCHRVLAAGGAIGGYAGGLALKRRILASEGVTFSRDGVLIGRFSPSC